MQGTHKIKICIIRKKYSFSYMDYKQNCLERERDRQPDTQRDREKTDQRRERQTDRQSETETQRDWETDTENNMQLRQTDREQYDEFDSLFTSHAYNEPFSFTHLSLLTYATVIHSSIHHHFIATHSLLKRIWTEVVVVFVTLYFSRSLLA